MRNRAKCRKCKEIIESFALEDIIGCSCGTIAICGGNVKFQCWSDSWVDFIRIDEDGNEITVKVLNTEEAGKQVTSDVKQLYIEEKPLPKPDKKELLNELDLMIKNIEGLPQNALYAPVTHYDLVSALILVSALLRADD